MDDITSYKGPEAYWAASCAMDGIAQGEEIPSTADAGSYIDDVLEFVAANCHEEGITTPSKQECIIILKEMIESHLEDLNDP